MFSTPRWVTRVSQSLLVVILLSAPAKAQDNPPTVRVNATEITFSGRVQTQLNTSSVDGVAPSEIVLRRIRLGMDVRINEVVSGRIHPELSSGTLSLGDAYGMLTFDPGLQVWVGRFHRPLGLMEEVTSLRIIPIERGVRIRGVPDQELNAILSGLRYSDRDTGVKLQGAPTGMPLGLEYAIAIFAGPLQGSSGDEQTQQFVGRLMASPTSALQVGVGWSRRDFMGPTPDADFEAGDTFMLLGEFGGPTPAPGLHIVAQAAMGDYEPVAEETFTGAQGWVGYRLPFGGRVTVIEPLGRVSYASIDRDGEGGTQGGTLITPGLNLYFGGLNRLMFNYDLWRPADGPSARSFKAQFQFAF
jgi:hypothetical protein